MKKIDLLRPFAALTLVGLIVLLPTGCGPKPETKSDPTPDPKVEAEKAKQAQLVEDAKKRSFNNLKQIGLAVHNFASAYDSSRIPIGLLDPKTNRLGLSWRVQILPYIEQVALYKQFRLDEPWDSEHNRKLLPLMPEIYKPVLGQAQPGYTFYQGFAPHFVGPNGEELVEKAVPSGMFHSFLFQDPRSIFQVFGAGAPMFGIPVPPGYNLANIPDGTSNTILVVEAGEAVPWTKPQDIPVRLAIGDKEKKNITWPKLGGLFDGDFHALMLDGDVYAVKKDVPPTKLRPFILADDLQMVKFADIGVVPDWVKNLPPPQGEPHPNGK